MDHEARRIAALDPLELHQELADHEAMSSLLVTEIRRRQTKDEK